jgi:ABC-type branched-subunit amino acid transport system ATPase component
VPGLSIGGYSFTRNDYYWFALGIFVLSMGAIQQLSSSALGRTWVAIRENEPAAASLGISPIKTKMLNLGTSGALAGLAGALFAHLAGGIFPESASFSNAIRLFVAIVVGGTGTFAGPIAGMALIATVDRFTVNWTTAQPIIFSGILIGSLALMRFGIVGTVLLGRFGRFFLVIPELAAFTGSGVIERMHPRKRGTLLKVTDLAKRFDGVHALSGVDISVREGTIHGLIGPNGSGKSTLVNCITGTIPRDHGQLVFDGKAIDHPKPHEMAKIGMVRIFQHSENFGRLLVIQNVLMGLHLRADRNLLRCMLPLPGRRRSEQALIGEALQILSAAGLAHRALSPVAGLPYGEQRLLEIARAVAARPKLLILDEPATGLTRPELERLADLLRKLRDSGVTVLLIEHNMEFVMSLVDRITVLERGRRIAVGDPAKIQANDEVIEAYLGERVSA